MSIVKVLITAIMAIVVGVSCDNDDKSDVKPTISEGTDPNFKIVANNEGVLSPFTKKVDVFGVKIFAVPTIDDAKLLHAANVMAQYLDNNEDGKADNPKVLKKLLEQKSALVMWKKESDLNMNPPRDMGIQDLGNDETHPSFVTNGMKGKFDAALEEVLHLITHHGYSMVYPEVFGEKPGSKIALAMDLARGGMFQKIPSSYPKNAWYTYDDKTCNYSCQVTEYFYWALTSLLGAQKNRSSEIGHEWKLNTKEKVQNGDVTVFNLLNNSEYKLPTVLPDGTYRR